MIRFHKEGNFIILTTTALVALGAGLTFRFVPPPVSYLIFAVLGIFYYLILQFFRNPVREIPDLDNAIVYAPADGKVVVIEETFEPEYFKDKRLQVSIFMSPLNVHVNRNPIGGEIKYSKYHEGKYLVAWHPKASTENERTSVVFSNGKTDILLRQIAGALAKRIVNYAKTGDRVVQGDDMGFIKFGSRVDLYFPIGTQIDVKIGDIVKGNKTIVGRI